MSVHPSISFALAYCVVISLAGAIQVAQQGRTATAFALVHLAVVFAAMWLVNHRRD